MPNGDNDGMIAKTEVIKLGPNINGNKHHTVTSTNKGTVPPAIECLLLNDSLERKLNIG